MSSDIYIYRYCVCDVVMCEMLYIVMFIAWGVYGCCNVYVRLMYVMCVVCVCSCDLLQIVYVIVWFLFVFVLCLFYECVAICVFIYIYQHYIHS